MTPAFNLIETLPRPGSASGIRPANQQPQSFLQLLRGQLLHPRESRAAPADGSQPGRFWWSDPKWEQNPDVAYGCREKDLGLAEQLSPKADFGFPPVEDRGCRELSPDALLDSLLEVLTALSAADISTPGARAEPALIPPAEGECRGKDAARIAPQLLEWLLPDGQGVTAGKETVIMAGGQPTPVGQPNDRPRPALTHSPAAASRLEAQLLRLLEQLKQLPAQPGSEKGLSGSARQALARIVELLDALNGQPAASRGRRQPPPGLVIEPGRGIKAGPSFDSGQPAAAAPEQKTLRPGTGEIYQPLHLEPGEAGLDGARPPAAAGKAGGEPLPAPLHSRPEGPAAKAAEEVFAPGGEAAPAAGGPGGEQLEGAGELPPDLREGRLQLPPLIKQVAAGMRLVSRGGRSEINLQLKPESLGRLSLTVAVENGLVTARLHAESRAVGQLIESSLGQLKQMLQEQGLRLERLEVAVGESSVQQDQGQQLSRYHQAPPDGSPSRFRLAGWMAEEAPAYAAEKPSTGQYWPNGQIDYLA